MSHPAPWTQWGEWKVKTRVTSENVMIDREGGSNGEREENLRGRNREYSATRICAAEAVVIYCVSRVHKVSRFTFHDNAVLRS
ncbi:hypothetical protein CBR_g22425 [Chara braunii]|uniref:Uncharacterized protein n=1 Tax=Chara braunii TaxID=69332 RepID=A0A388JV34_CHABU|nr:hypothetical protein CBR_g22425 [Chara braunii]|eukprot:GBG61627.1 hypothetical protein CBR_g22425 [Chara braunii]